MAEKLEIVISAKDQASKTIDGMKGTLTNAFKLVGGAAIAGGTAIAAGIGYGLKTAISEAMDAEETMAQLNAVIASTGGAAGMTSDSVTALADQLSGVTRYTDDAIVAGESMLLTFTNIGKDVFPAATETMLNMSTAMGQDVQSSAVQLGKALNDPIAGISALSRVGVTFTEDQKAVIEKLMETGDVASAQRLILDELAKEFGGSAEAAGATFAGQLDIMKNSINNTAEEVGKAVMPILQEMLATLLPYIQELSAKLVEFVQSEEFKKWAEDTTTWIRNDMIPAIDGLVKGFGKFVAFFSSPEWKKAVDALKWLNDWSESYVKIQFPNILAGIGKALWQLITGDWKQALGSALVSFSGFVEALMKMIQKFANAIGWTSLSQTMSASIRAQELVLAQWMKSLGLDAQGNPIQTSSSTTNNWNLTINSSATSESLVNDYGMMQAWAGGMP